MTPEPCKHPVTQRARFRLPDSPFSPSDGLDLVEWCEVCGSWCSQRTGNYWNLPKRELARQKVRELKGEMT